MKKTGNSALAAALVVLLCMEARAQMTFTPLGDLPGGTFTALSIMAASPPMVPSSWETATRLRAPRRSAGRAAAGWSAWATCREDRLRAKPTGVSADGSVVVGYGSSASGETAFRWTSGGGMVGLGDLPGGIFQSDAHSVSADGSVVVGNSTSASGFEAFRWTSGGGMVGLGDLPGGIFSSTAESISADGSVIVGVGNLDLASFTTAEAFRWTSGGGMVGLGDLPGGDFLERR